jgi:hypothetical protein
MAILVQLLPVSLAKLWELNDSPGKCGDAGDLNRCLSCGNVSRLGEAADETNFERPQTCSGCSYKHSP